MKSAFENVYKETFSEAMKELGRSIASRGWVYNSLKKRRTSLIIIDKVSKPRQFQISPLLFLIYTSSLYNMTRDTDV